MAETFVVPTKGIGKPDYSQEVALGQVRPGLTLKYGQTLKLLGITFSALWSPFAFVKPPLGIGLTAHFVDWETNLALPLTIPKGYLYTAIETRHSFTQDFTMMAYFEGFFVSYLATKAAGRADVFDEVAPLSTSIMDPLALSSHTYDVTIKNLGGAVMEGSVSIFAVVQKVGSEPFRKETKTVKCKFCDHEWDVPQETTSVNCPNCGQLNMYITLANFRGF